MTEVGNHSNLASRKLRASVVLIFSVTTQHGHDHQLVIAGLATGIEDVALVTRRCEGTFYFIFEGAAVVMDCNKLQIFHLTIELTAAERLSTTVAFLHASPCRARLNVILQPGMKSEAFGFGKEGDGFFFISEMYFGESLTVLQRGTSKLGRVAHYLSLSRAVQKRKLAKMPIETGPSKWDPVNG